MNRQDVDRIEVKTLDSLDDIISQLKELVNAYAEIYFFFPFKEFKDKRELVIRVLHEIEYLNAKLKGDDIL